MAENLQSPLLFTSQYFLCHLDIYYNSWNENLHFLSSNLFRLSKLSAQALASGKEAVADLSDENRPVKLGERYSELYDNEWTDAFEVLTSELHYDDKAAIKKLIEILNVSETLL